MHLVATRPWCNITTKSLITMRRDSTFRGKFEAALDDPGNQEPWQLGPPAAAWQTNRSDSRRFALVPRLSSSRITKIRRSRLPCMYSCTAHAGHANCLQSTRPCELLRFVRVYSRTWAVYTRLQFGSNKLVKFTCQMLCFSKLLKEYAKLKRGSLQQFSILNLPNQKTRKGPPQR
jgi:hypothetical protein